MKTKFIFITGGVVSSIGKGLAAASLGALLEARGLRVTMQKLDPYINVDPGTMSPFQHGEVFVTDDGAETDLDLGHYERYTSARLSKKSNFTTGQVYFSVIDKERRGDYLGGTVQVIPHITDEIKSKVIENAKGADVAIIEVGGTVGDIESLPFLEAIRQFRYDRGHGNTLYIHVTLVPYIRTAGELKTKPTQHSVMELRKIGIQPDILLCRCDRELPQEMKKKIALFCNVEEKDVIQVVDSEHIYAVPQALSKERLDEQVVDKLNIWTKAPDLTPWQDVVETLRHPSHGEVRIAVVGKYVNLTESYKSLAEALTHGGIANDCRVYLKYVDSEKIERDGIGGHLDDVDGILVPGGFGERGTEGKITAIQYRPHRKDPFFRDMPGDADGGHRILPQRLRHRGCLFKRVHGVRLPTHPSDGGAEIRQQKGGDHEAWGIPLFRCQGDPCPCGLQRDRDLRAASPPLRIQQQIPLRAHRKGDDPVRHLQGQGSGGDHRTARPSLVPGVPVPPRIQVQTAPAPPALPGFYRRSACAPRYEVDHDP